MTMGGHNSKPLLKVDESTYSYHVRLLEVPKPIHK